MRYIVASNHNPHLPVPPQFVAGEDDSGLIYTADLNEAQTYTEIEAYAIADELGAWHVEKVKFDT